MSADRYFEPGYIEPGYIDNPSGRIINVTAVNPGVRRQITATATSRPRAVALTATSFRRAALGPYSAGG